jgi:hypothetical protein
MVYAMWCTTAYVECQLLRRAAATIVRGQQTAFSSTIDPTFQGREMQTANRLPARKWAQ